MSQDTSQIHIVVTAEDNSSTGISEPPTKIFKPDHADADPNTAVSATNNSTEITDKSPAQPSRKPRTRLSPAEKAVKDKEKKQRLEARAVKDREREEAKKKKEEEARKQQKNSVHFLKFFTKKPTAEKPPALSDSTADHLWFKPFFVQPFMTVAKPPRQPLPAEDIETLDESLMKQDINKLYLDTVKMRGIKLMYRQVRGRTPNSAGNILKSSQQGISTDPITIDIDMSSDGDIDMSSDGDIDPSKSLTLDRIRPKLLQFHENYRPSYFGTFQKRSKVVGPRRPTAKDVDVMNYDVDSDEEWEEEEPGESISDSEGEENENGQEEDDEDDGFFVPHGYLSEDEGGDAECREMDICGDAEQRCEVAHAKAVETELARKCQPLRPFVIGCVWTSHDGTPSTENSTVMGHTLDFLLEKLKLCEAVPIVPAPIEVMKSINSIARVETALSVPSAVKTVSSPISQSVGAPKMPVPDEALPDLVRFIHGNSYGMKKLLNTFRNYWAVKTGLKTASASVDNLPFHHNSGISKRQLEMKITSMAVKELRTGYPRSCWYVHTHVISQVGLREHDLPVPNHTFVAQVQSVAAQFRPPVKTLSADQFSVLKLTNSGKPGQGHAVLSVNVPVIDLTVE